MHRCIIALLFAAIFFFVSLGEVTAKRTMPEPVTPVVSEGVRYTAPHFLPDKKQAGGFVQALDDKTGKLLWEVKVYTLKFDEHLERDVQEVFIKSLELVAKTKLVATDEGGRRFEIDLTNKAVKALPKKK